MPKNDKDLTKHLADILYKTLSDYKGADASSWGFSFLLFVEGVNTSSPHLKFKNDLKNIMLEMLADVRDGERDIDGLDFMLMLPDDESKRNREFNGKLRFYALPADPASQEELDKEMVYNKFSIFVTHAFTFHRLRCTQKGIKWNEDPLDGILIELGIQLAKAKKVSLEVMCPGIAMRRFMLPPEPKPEVVRASAFVGPIL